MVCVCWIYAAAFPCCLCFVLLNRDFVFSHSGALGGIGVDRGESLRCVFTSHTLPREEI